MTRVAVVHYWLVGMRGGEKVLEALLELFPEADLYTHVYRPDRVSPRIRERRVRTTFIQRLPRADRWYRRYLPLMPLALEQLDLSGYDLVLSSESGPAKGVLTSPRTLHVCYCHTPMRYVWDLYHEYRASSGPLTRLLMPPFVHYLRLWDGASADRVDRYVANSRTVQRRIRKHWRRDATVVHPPVDVDAFAAPAEDPERPAASPDGDDFYLLLGQLVPYKRADLALEAFRKLDRRLIVIGGGEQLEELRRRADARVTFLGHRPDDVVRDHLRRARALVFPGIEDFGIVPVEAMAAGTPVIAYAGGGALETVIDEVTGVFFHRQTPDALADAVRRFEDDPVRFDGEEIRRHARAFGRERFLSRMQDLLGRWMREHDLTPPW